MRPIHCSNIETMLSNSYRDFHAKGVDYICLSRSPSDTVKLYFFDGVPPRDVVYPHDHRYDFTTEVLAGGMTNISYGRSDGRSAKVYNRFEYRTPLNGGSGFTFAEEVKLVEIFESIHVAGGYLSGHWSPAETIHTIRVAPGTALLLHQYEDRVPVGEPTSTFASGDPPTTDGLYKRWTADDLLARLRLVEERSTIRFEAAST